ncbi:MAG: hypothetical protein KME59_05095 [Trichormus sp. ATA11-4-KO1]|jgi:hypothetical protein|nr:hypothetical protein [Trichormus sp. ATA11-4-KO1]
MEHSQSVQYEPTQVTELTNDKSGVMGSSNIFIYLLTHHPGLLLAGLLTMLLGSAALALYSLGYAGSGDNAELEEIPAVVEKPITTSSENSNATPLWMVAAIALSCASGCFIIVRLLNHPNQRQKVRKPIKRDRQPIPLKPSSREKWEPMTLKSPPVFVPMQPLKPINQMRAKSRTLVTVLPPDHRHPLDQRKESLADLMDIRKQSSLSAILQKY